jgi:Family of unknown function (DUF6807)
MRTLSLAIALVFPLSAIAADPVPIAAKADKTTIEFTAGKEVVTRYHIGEGVAKPYFWPLNAPGEVPVTRGWPMQKGLPAETTDHVHQKSAWFCHGDVIPEGIEMKTRSSDKRVKGVDFWAESKGHGTIVCVKADEPTVTGGKARVVTKNEWRTPDGVNILDEERVITVQDLGDARLIVLEIDLHATVCPITFGDTKEGSMGVRVNDEFRLTAPGGDSAITSSDGTIAKSPAKDNLPMWGKRADWHDYSGMVGGTADGKVAGIAVFDHPKNAARAAWHTRAYGLMAANPFGRAESGFPALKGQTELVKLAKGDHLKLRYAILVHRGDVKEGKVAEHFAAFAKD